MKKPIIFLLLLALVTVTSCINYKADNNAASSSVEEDLLKEIAAIEQELEQTEPLPPQETVEEVIIPALGQAANSEATSAGSSTEQVITVKENQRITLQPKVIDPDLAEVTITYSTPMNAQGEWQTNYGDAGEYIVAVTATDKITTAMKRLKKIVEKENVAPTIENIKDITVNEGELVQFTPEVKDLNGDKVTVTTSEPLQENIFKTDFNSAGVYPVSITASDGELSTTKSFTLTVTNVNQKPLIRNEERLLVKEGETLQLVPLVEDPDGDKVTASISEPLGQDGFWQLSYTDHGEYFVTITATDGVDTVSKKITIIVEDVNAPVEFIDIIVDVN